MELIQTAYRILFNLEFELEAFDLDIVPFLRVVPDQGTNNILMQYAMLSKSQKNARVFLIQTEPSGAEEEEPKIMLEVDEIFRFQVKFPVASFFDSTHLDGYDLSEDVFVLTNGANHTVGTELLLSLPIAAYNAADEYFPGYIVESAGNFFKALQPSNNTDPHPVTELAFWRPLTEGTYLSQTDIQAKSSLSYPVDLDTVLVIEIKHSTLINADYQLLDAGSKCREVSYKMKFLKQN